MVKKNIIVIAIIAAVLLGVLMVVALMSQFSGSTSGRITGNLGLGYKDKSPYGGYVAHKLMPSQFHKNPVQVVTKPFTQSYNNIRQMNNPSGGGSNYILLGRQIFTSEDDVRDMLSYVKAGNRLFIAASSLDTALAAAFGFGVAGSGVGVSSAGNVITFVNPHLDKRDFSYKGDRSISYFSSLDTAVTKVLATDDKAHPTFIRVTKGDGQLFVMLQPYVFANYFLTTGDNAKALENAMAYLLPGVNDVYWDEFYKHQTGPQRGNFSNWQVLMRYPAMRWAFLLGLLLLLLFAVFESKRRQRIIPPKPPVSNTSLEFVQTLGRLYYVHHNNLNLARKMSVHLLEFVRTRYNLNTTVLDAVFIHALARKSGHDAGEVEKMIRMIDHVRLAGSISDIELKEFYNSIYHFYLKTN